MDKKGKMDILTLVLVGLGIYLVFGSGFLKPQTQAQVQTGTGQSVTPTNTVQIVGAPCTQATTLTASVVRRYTDVSQTAENVTVFQNGVLKGTVAHGGTTTVQSGPNADTLDLYVADASKTFYTRHLRGKITTCTGSATTGDAAAFKEVPVSEDLGTGVVLGTALGYSDFPNKVLQVDNNGNSNWFSIVNDGQANQNTGGQGEGTGANLTVGQGGTGSVSITFRPGYNLAIGPNGNVLACQFPQAVYDSVAPVLVSYAGVALQETPTKPSTQNYPLIAANNTVKAFAFPGVDGRKTPSVDIKVTLRADSNHNPAGANDRLNCTIFDSDFYQRQSDGKQVIDIENRDTNADLGMGETSITIPNPSFTVGVA